VWGAVPFLIGVRLGEKIFEFFVLATTVKMLGDQYPHFPLSTTGKVLW